MRELLLTFCYLSNNKTINKTKSHHRSLVVGGDGTLNYFINQYPQFALPLAIFRGGTGNDFHWLLYGDVTEAEQVDLVLSASPQPVDAGLCNHRLFINGVDIGFDGKVAKDLMGKQKRAGKASYMLTILKTFSAIENFSAL